jgi:hypothetical protein
MLGASRESDGGEGGGGAGLLSRILILNRVEALRRLQISRRMPLRENKG